MAAASLHPRAATTRSGPTSFAAGLPRGGRPGAAAPTPRRHPPTPAPPPYPLGLTVTPDGRTLLVVQNRRRTVAAIDLATGRRKAEAATGSLPFAVVVSASGEKAYVSN